MPYSSIQSLVLDQSQNKILKMYPNYHSVLVPNILDISLSITFVTRGEEFLSKIECIGNVFHLETINIKLRLQAEL